jgi:hypothetical protein
MHVALMVSLGHSFVIWPNYLQLWHFKAGFSSAQYLVTFAFIKFSKALPSLSSSSSI